MNASVFDDWNSAQRQSGRRVVQDSPSSESAYETDNYNTRTLALTVTIWVAVRVKRSLVIFDIRAL